MKTVLLVAVLVVVGYLLYASIRFYNTVQVSKGLIRAAAPYQLMSDDKSVALLVLGDSTAVGVGSDSPEHTVAGRLAMRMSATSVENYSLSGAVTADLKGQIAQAKSASYKLILVQIGGNDIIRFRTADETAIELKLALQTLPKADKVIVISAGNVGGATLFPFFLRPFYSHLNQEYHIAFAKTCESLGITYVNLGEDAGSKKIEREPKIYLSADGLHPSAAGYALWFDAINSALVRDPITY